MSKPSAVTFQQLPSATDKGVQGGPKRGLRLWPVGAAVACFLLLALAGPLPSAIAAGDNDSVSLLGLPGTLRTLSAFPPDPQRWSHNAMGGLFITRDLALEGMDHSEFEASYALAYRPWLTPTLSELSLSFQAGARGDVITNDDEKVATLNLGDMTLGAHYGFWNREDASLAAALPVLLQARAGDGSAGFSASPTFLLLGAIRPPGAPDGTRHEIDLNLGFRLDGTESYLKSRDEENTRYSRAVRGQFSESSYVVQAAYRAVIGRAQPYLEVAFWKDADGKAVNSKGDKVKLPFGSNPTLVTPGVKAWLTPAIQLQGAVDLGFLTGSFPDENEMVPPWKVWFGVMWAYGGAPEPPLAAAPPAAEIPVVVEAPPEQPPQTTVEGKLLDPAGLPIVAVITIDDRWKTQSSPTDGSFSITIDVGRHVMVIAGEGFETITQEIDAAMDRPIVVDVVLKPTGKVRVTGDKIVIYVKVFFATAKAEILSESFAVLDEVGAVMERAPQLRVRVEGHTDSTGNKERNLRLSQERAESVVAYIVSKGIDPARLEAMGYGDAVPLAENNTEEGKSKNRRVEFTILENPGP